MLIKKFEEQVKKTPHHIAVKTENKTITYDDLDKYANRIARSIGAVCPKKQEIGRVGLLLEHGLEMIEAILGTLKAGKAYVPLSPDYPYQRVSYMLENSESSLLIANRKSEEKAKALARENNIPLLNLDRCDEELPNPGEGVKISREIQGERLAYILYTSGSTGRPKGVVQNHRNVLYYIRNWTRVFSITDTDRMTLFSSFCHDGSVQDMFGALLNGASLYPYDVRQRNDGIKLSRFLLDEKITIWHSVPSLYNFFVNTLTGKEQFDDLRWLLLGGEPFRGYEIEMFKKYFPSSNLADVYGQTESSVTSIWTIRPEDIVTNLIIGTPLDNTRIFIVDQQGEEIDEMETGEILVACPHISPGYWKDEALTKKSFSMDPEFGLMYWTGDLGRLLSNGNIEFLGRKDFQVKIRGFRVEMGEIETTLLKMDGIKETVVTAKESATGNIYLCAFFTAINQLDAKDLRKFLSGQLPDYMIPLHYQQLDHMPLTQSGKIDRKALANIVIEPLRSKATYAAPETSMEKTVADIWKEVLKMEEVGVHDNLFEIGGNSFDIIKINSQLSELLQKNIPMVKLFEYPTIRALASYLNQPGEGTGIGKENGIPGNHREKRGVSAEIAVIGMAGRFPGAKSIDEFWENLKKGIESISFFSGEEMTGAGISPRLGGAPDYVKAKGILEDIEFFDADFFNFTPGEAEVMDPQLRIFHECAWEALENAGYTSSNYQGLIGVYSGNAFNLGWLALAFTQNSRMVGELEKGLLNNHLSTYISYKLDLKGPSVTVRTACSTSLVAVHMACQGLSLRECDMALAGGVSISIPKKSGYLYQEGMIHSSDGHVRAFTAQSSGTVFGDGVGCVVLKRLEDAAAEGDYIYAVIKGTAINNDGIGKVGYTAPGLAGQREVVRAAQTAAGIEPESISFIETHGTGTPLGDAVEMEALKQVFYGHGKNYCAVASVKSNVGHLNAAAGIAGFIKTALALEYKQIPPSLHYETPNPEIDFENSPFYVNTKLSEWKNDKYPLRAGVSSFGLGGTNAHVVLEQAPVIGEKRKEREYQLILLSAKTPTALDKMTQNLAEYLKKNLLNPGNRENPVKIGSTLADAAYTLQVGKAAFPYRNMLVCSTVEQAVQALTTCESPTLPPLSVKEDDTPVIFMFTGIGSQYVNMGRELYQKEPVFKKEMDTCFNILKSITRDDIKAILYPQNSVSQVSEVSEVSEECRAVDNRDNRSHTFYKSYKTYIDRFEIAQLVIFIFEYALSRLLMEWGIKPKAMIGYSFGEYIAACISGVYSLEDALKLVVSRGRLIEKVPPGAMLSVPLPQDQVKPMFSADLSIAIDNGPSCIISGSKEAVDAFEKKMKEKKYLCMRLPTSYGIHSALMSPILAEFEKQVAQVTLRSLRIPYISNVTGDWITPEQAADPAYWAKHLSSSVQFAQGMKKLLNEKNAVFIEVGPGRDLSTLVQRYIEDNPANRVLNLVRNPQKKVSDVKFLLKRIGYLWLWGKKINWNEFHLGEKQYRLPLPTYPFERQRYWIENRPVEVGIGKREITDWYYLPWWKPSVLPSPQPGDAHEHRNWLVFIDESGIGLQLVKQLEKEQRHREIVIVETGTGYARKNDRTYTIEPGNENDYKALFRELHQRQIFPPRILHFWTVMKGNREEPGMEWMEKCQELGYYSLIFLARAIAEQEPRIEVRVTVVTNNMVGIYEDDLLYPEKATLLGPVNIIPKEYLKIKCRALDFTLSAKASGNPQKQKIVRQILDEIKADSLDTATAYRGNKRFIQTYEPVKLEKPAGIPPRLREKGIYLITGGLGGIGLVQAEYLAGLVKAGLILTGRSAFPDRDQWEQWLSTHPEDDAVCIKIKKLQKIEKLGGRVLVCKANVSDPEQMEEMICQAEKQLGPVNGIIHNALQIDGGVIHSINRQNTENVFAAKVRGTLTLEKIFKHRQLDFFILSSSTASVVMDIGHVAYASASAFLDAYAQHKSPIDGGATIGINWGAWQEVGGAMELTKEHGRALGISESQSKIRNGILSGEGMEAFNRILGLNPSMPRVVVSPQDLNQQIKLSEALNVRGIREPAANAAQSRKRTPRPALDSDYVPARNDIQRKLVETWCEFFGFETIGIRDDFFELGGDSLKAIIVTSLIHKHFHVEVGIATIFNKSTIEELAGYIKNSAEKNTYSPIKPGEKKEYYMLSSSQKRVYILQRLESASTAFNITQIVGIQGKPTPATFEKAFKKLIERHESFRTSFWMMEDTPIQKISRAIPFDMKHDEVETRENNGSKLLSPNDGMHMSGESLLVNDLIRPFDLIRPPLLRVGLIKLAETHYLLMVDMHHIISDGVSQSILIKEMVSLYKGEELSPLKLQYKDFAGWQHTLLNSKKIKKQERYWLDRFKGEIPLLEIPTDYPRKTWQSFEGEGLVFEIDGELTKKLQTIISTYGTTLYMTLLALFSILLSKYTDQTDIIIGSPTAGRVHAELNKVVGMFVNVLLIRSSPTPAKTFVEFLQEIKTLTLEAFENQDYQFDDLVERLKLNRNTERNPLYNVIFAVMNMESPVDRLPGLNLQPHPVEKMTAKTELRLGVMETAGTITMKFTYVIALYKKETIEEMARHYIDILKQVIENNKIKLKDIKISHHMVTLKPIVLRSDESDFIF